MSPVNAQPQPDPHGAAATALACCPPAGSTGPQAWAAAMWSHAATDIMTQE